MFFDIEKDVDKGALSEALSDSAEVTVVSLNLKNYIQKRLQHISVLIDYLLALFWCITSLENIRLGSTCPTD